jgi:hypothetical protein
MEKNTYFWFKCIAIQVTILSFFSKRGHCHTSFPLVL